MGLGDGPSTGWPATDFIEDILLSRSGAQTYQAWAAGTVPWTSPPVAAAWHEWGRIATRDDLVRGGRPGVVLTDFTAAGRSMFQEHPGCSMEHQASFMTGFYRKANAERKLAPGVDFDFVPFPAFTDRPAAHRPVVASADFAGLFDNTPQARRLMRFLATDEAQTIWPAMSGSGAFVVNRHVRPEVYDDDVSRRVATTIQQATDLCIDASDFMPATMRNAFYRAILDYLANPAQLPALLRQLDSVRVDSRKDWLDLLSCRR
jgi:alpha-glucoside transport system substrate-binding protein